MERLLTGIRADAAQSYRSIEKFAIQAREILGCSPLQRIDAQKFFERDLGDITVGDEVKSFTIREALEDMTAEGMSRWIAEDNTMEVVLSEHTYGMLKLGHPRAAYTVLHEFGHVVLHSDQIIRLAGLSLQSQVALHRDKESHSACWDTEWQANAFAAAILMPAAGIDLLKQKWGRVSSHLIAAHFRTSAEAASYRLDSIRRL
jgi:hypothetical protein